jgi:carboxyl-terminal processing protease
LKSVIIKFKNKGIVGAFYFSACLICSAFAQAQPANLLHSEALLLRTNLEKNHYDPPVLDDQLSKKIFYNFIELLDPHHLYFTSADIKALSVYKNQIDDEFKGSAWKFLPYVTGLYKERLLKSEKTFNGILQEPFNYSLNERISFSKSDSGGFALDEKDYLQRWTKWLKYQTLVYIINQHMRADSGSAKTTASLSKEAAMRDKVRKIETRGIKRILDHPAGFENYVGSILFNALTSCYDAHSNYFSKTDWQNFQNDLSTESYSFGIDISESETGDIVIERLVPGGPAWKSNELHKGDILLQLQWSGKIAMDLDGAEKSEVESMFLESNTEKMEIKVKKSNGQIKSVTLVKDKIRDDENIVKSFILQGEKKIGYISLPGFYTEWENAAGKGCSNDVAKEILKLKEEKIDGLILDIRYNGGGALIEGLNLAGIFINEGPLFMMQKKDKKPAVIKDMNRGTVYDGPMAVMINGQSASASELLASTLQDYNRAVIVGSRSFGKATGQATMALDTTMKDLSDLKSDYGVVAVTVEKLYRVSGRSAQLNGVRPDVFLPDIYENLNYYEGSLPCALVSDSVSKKVIYSPLSALPISELRRQSAQRVASSDEFKVISKLAKDPLLNRKDKEEFALTISSLSKVIDERYVWNETFEAASIKSTDLFKVDNVNFDMDLIKMDTYGKEINSIIIENIQRDIYLAETFQILTNLINLTK